MIKLQDLSEFEGDGGLGGMSAEGTRGRLAQSWWAQRFLGVIEDVAAKPALDHGRRYARKGQVVSLVVEPGQILAKVEGTQPTPYVCRIAGTVCSDDRWNAVFAEMVRTSVHFTALLAGQMSRTLDDVFEAAGARLFPRCIDELTCECSCQEPPSPCKHVVAAACLFADRLDTDPGLLLQWRGRYEAEALGVLRRSWGAPESITEAEDRQDTTLAHMDLMQFYDLSPAVDAMPPMAPAENYPDVMKRLGFPPFFPPGDRTVQQVLNNLYDES